MMGYDARRMKRALLVLVLALPIYADGFVRIAVAREASRDTIVRDRDCASAEPPALFGCGLFAEGDFGKTTAWEIGVGMAAARTRADLSLARRGFELDANANFTGVAGEQPVVADIVATSLMVNVAMDLAPYDWRVKPFVTIGGGASRIDAEDVTYRFPALGENAVTITQGGTFTSPAWTAGVGVSLDVTSRLAVDLIARYSDLGDLRTDAGSARIIRPNRELTIDIAGTRAELETVGAAIALRYRL